MLFHLLYPLRDYFSGFNVFQYITFRSAGAAVSALLISFMVGPFVIRLLHKHGLGEEIRSDGPESHQAKKGTPTMGGLLILTAIILPTLLWADLFNHYVQLALFATCWMGFVGWLDDYLKVVKKIEKGLVARYKLFGQITLGLIIGSIVYFSPEWESVGTRSYLPFFKGYQIDYGVFYIPMVVFAVTWFSNAVNLTDGLDGLATGLVCIAALAFTVMAYATGNSIIANYLYIDYLAGSGEMTVFLSAMVGATLGFLWFNSKPAQVIMGDTGALALGGALGVAAILIKKEILLVFVGSVFLMETLSVVIQVLYFRYTKRKFGEGVRFFKMAPIHHHFELKGMDESKIVVRFWIIGILSAIISLSTFKLR
ncbi:phospho-N-acetylmuramoyl-pentapeptide-transferase [Candidatus Marinimicrobia bacterium MT.SAG.3]|nr:phospho-N-acetylmuramoyl-pentapeptide-transferase [Candidatus Marinimicrobia bacterium MT.SAG.3]TFB14009.1 phospho-N-acetylmuramoyl-pentapeptide-transferase [Candidatus Marinimicrobia bacterium MT.SAG.4]